MGSNWQSHLRSSGKSASARCQNQRSSQSYSSQETPHHRRSSAYIHHVETSQLLAKWDRLINVADPDSIAKNCASFGPGWVPRGETDEERAWRVMGTDERITNLARHLQSSSLLYGDLAGGPPVFTAAEGAISQANKKKKAEVSRGGFDGEGGSAGESGASAQVRESFLEELKARDLLVRSLEEILWGSSRSSSQSDGGSDSSGGHQGRTLRGRGSKEDKREFVKAQQSQSRLRTTIQLPRHSPRYSETPSHLRWRDEAFKWPPLIARERAIATAGRQYTWGGRVALNLGTFIPERTKILKLAEFE